MTDLALAGARRSGRRRLGSVLMGLLLTVGALTLAGGPIAYMLWPRAAAVAPDAPTLPITVGGVVFNVPPAAVRVAVQRRPGAQARVDLAFLWPSLAPPDLTAKASPASPPNIGERIFVTIAAADGTLAPPERLKAIYPRYTGADSPDAPEGLSVRPFRTGTPYQGEDLIHDPAAPARFLLRCTRGVGATPGMCLHERRIFTADVTVRFPRAWLADWRAVAGGIDRLMTSLRPAGH
jgi:hypothetical protein